MAGQGCLLPQLAGCLLAHLKTQACLPALSQLQEPGDLLLPGHWPLPLEEDDAPTGSQHAQAGHMHDDLQRSSVRYWPRH